MLDWLDRLRDDPTPWLLDPTTPAVRHLALRQLLDRPIDDPEVAEAGTAAMAEAPIAAILAAQDPQGWWVKPGNGYGPKYTGTVWSLIFLDQMGADGSDPRIEAACEYVLEHTQAPGGGFAALSQGKARAVPSGVIHCLHGNLLRALIDFGRLDDPRVQEAIAWQVAAITGKGMARWYAFTPGPGFRCGANSGEPCAWGAIKALLGLAAIPLERRDSSVREAIESGVALLLSRDPAVADYPTPRGQTAPSGSWFRLGFPSGYVTDVLQNLEAIVAAGAGADRRIDAALDWLLAQQDARGRWPNRYSYQGKMHVDLDRTAMPSKWVTLRACRVLKGVAEARA